MNDRQHIKTTVQESIDYWSRHVNECGLSVDWSEAETHCWRCGCKRNLERCHIVPHALGGKDEPSNIVLLCHRCHAEGPNVNDPEIMWDWLKAYGVSYYGTFWKIVGMKEYRFIYRHSALEEAEAILESAGIPVDSPLAQKLFNDHLDRATQEASIHYGQPYFNAATMAGIVRVALKKMAKTLGVDFPSLPEVRDIAHEPWWSELT